MNKAKNLTNLLPEANEDEWTKKVAALVNDSW